jgi:hypothetical protein
MVDGGTGASGAVAVERPPRAAAAPAEAAPRRAWGWPLAVGLLVLGALGLRLWGIKWGLPFVYNLDERSHFVPRAVGFFRNGTLDPHYGLNPSGLIEWVAAALLVTHGSGHAVVRTWQQDPGQIWMTARIASALLSTSAVWLVYVAGRRMFDRWVGFVAAAILATSFLPVHYGHLALNDAPSLAPTALALVGAAGVARTGRLREYLIAGVALGISVGFKYNAAFGLIPLVAAALIHARRERGRAALGMGAALGGALAGFLLCDPYALIHFRYFESQLKRLSDYTSGTLLLGETQRSGYLYYGWTLLWGYGVLPLALTLLGAGRAVARHRWQAALLVPAPILFFAVTGSENRYFGRWGMPVYPLLAILAGVGAVWLARAALRRAPRMRALAPLALLLICAQGVVFAVHNDLVLSRPDTRSTAREWMVRNVPAGTAILVEPIAPKEWYVDGGRLPDQETHVGYRWARWVRTQADIRRLAEEYPGARRSADFANFGFTLFPGLLPYLRERGVCWIVSSSEQSGRAFKDPGRVPEAIAYYRALAREADLRYRIRPFPGASADHYFQYDLAHDFAPLRFRVPGPAVAIYRLHGCTPRVEPPSRR